MTIPDHVISLVEKCEAAERERDGWRAKFEADGLEVVQLYGAAEDRIYELKDLLGRLLKITEARSSLSDDEVCDIDAAEAFLRVL